MDEISLDPTKPWLQMGTRQLGSRPWLVSDDKRLDELALKHQLLAADTDAVLRGADASAEAGRETLDLVRRDLSARQQQSDHAELQAELLAQGRVSEVDVVASSELSALDQAGRLVQEDLCLLERLAPGWSLQAASLCFPSRWRLADKIGLPLGAVHSPVPGYDDVLQSRVDSLLDRLDDTIVWRRNWFIHPDASLHQPDRPMTGDPVIARDRCGQDLFVRSERQTLRKLPSSGWCLFTIRIQQASLDEFLEGDRSGELSTFLEQSSAKDLAHRGLGADQVDELKLALR